MENISVNASSIEVDLDSMTASVYVDIDGWDSQKRAYHDIESFADGNNDCMAEDIQIELDEQFGVALEFPGTVDDEGTTVEFKLFKV